MLVGNVLEGEEGRGSYLLQLKVSLAFSVFKMCSNVLAVGLLAGTVSFPISDSIMIRVMGRGWCRSLGTYSCTSWKD